MEKEREPIVLKTIVFSSDIIGGHNFEKYLSKVRIENSEDCVITSNTKFELTLKEIIE